jgi:hypothetical protein
MRKKYYNQSGSITTEYIIISTFALIASITAAGLLGKIFYDKLSAMKDKMEQTEETVDFDFFR